MPAGMAAGVDGCPGGWIYATRRPGEPVTIGACATFAELLNLWSGALIAVDIPIGLPSEGSRECDQLARRLVGARRASVFPAPLSSTVGSVDHVEASARRRQVEGKGMSVQSFNILSKVSEVNSLLTPVLQDRVVEVHPEVCFAAMNAGRPLAHAKKQAPGRQERFALLLRYFPDLGQYLSQRRPGRAAADDLLDAYAALWTAERLVSGVASRIPEFPPRDERGLRMEMWY